MEKLKKLEWVLNRLTLLGYGLFSLENIEERNLQIEISVKNCFNADGYQTSKKPICYAMAGTLAGTMESIFKREMSCTEISCKATGKPVCSFKLTAGKPLPPKGFGASVYLPPRKLQNGKTIEKYELLYDETVGELIFEKTRSVVVVRGQRARYLREFENIIGPSARSIIYNISKNAAIEAVSNVKKSIIKIIGLFAKKPIVVELLKQLPRRGFGVPTIIDFDSKKPFIKIRVKNCYGTEGFYESTEPVCYALAGIFSGGAEVIFNREMACIETKCAAMGEKYCEFEISGGSRAFME
jgi:predicted hydrocarbon binding protein